jgi:DNA-binding NarL/FixJ family response regulator
MVAKVRLIICHQIPLFRECLISALAGVDGREIAVMDEPSMEALPPSRPEGLDLLLLDAGLPDKAAFRLVHTLSTSTPDLRVILLASPAPPEMIADCLRAGADGCVLDEDTFDDLRHAIEVVLQGRKYLSPQIVQRLLRHTGELASSNRASDGPPDCPLTPRQIEILQMFADRELSNKQIARELHISVYTVKNHFHSIFEKLNVEDRRSAVRFAFQQGLLGDSITRGKPNLEDCRPASRQAIRT